MLGEGEERREDGVEEENRWDGVEEEEEEEEDERGGRRGEGMLCKITSSFFSFISL